MYKQLSLLLFVLLVSVSCFAQQSTEKLYQHTQIMGIGGLWQNKVYKYYPDGRRVTSVNSTNVYGAALNYTVGINLNSRFGLGVKTGINTYFLADKGAGQYVLIPVMANVMAYLSPRTNTFYADVDYGYSFGLSKHNPDNSAKGGPVFNGSLGYRFGGPGSSNMTVSLGVVADQHIGMNDKAQYFKRPSISAFILGVGLMF